MSNPKEKPAPVLDAYARNVGAGDQVYWTKIGVAWERANGKPGFVIRLEAYPVNPEIFLFPPKADAKA
ncbi:hypothetical protein WI697_26475 [Tistrella mobilis]|uniref:hypothetical protein n=1 Tax=Tistrella mobilis TaxID=171437 RepID=UPI0031F68061